MGSDPPDTLQRGNNLSSCCSLRAIVRSPSLKGAVFSENYAMSDGEHLDIYGEVKVFSVEKTGAQEKGGNLSSVLSVLLVDKQAALVM